MLYMQILADEITGTCLDQRIFTIHTNLYVSVDRKYTLMETSACK
jgi:hypothetical protein